MAWIREYLLRVVAAAMFCGILTGIFGKKGAVGAAVKLMAGIFMLLTIVSPLMNVSLGNISGYLGNLSEDADSIVAEGKLVAKDSLSDIIKSKTEAYILDKADSFGAEVSVEVRVDAADLPMPCHVCVRGSISPYGRKRLEEYITNELGIALEEQEWIG